MIKYLITSLPMLVCLFWSAVLWMDWREQRSVAKLRLMAFSITAALLYMGHYVYFNHEYELIPVTDTIYCMANLMVFPLYHLYINEVTQPRWNRMLQLYTALPAIIVGAVVGTAYILMSSEEQACFIDSYLYGGNCAYSNTVISMQAVTHSIAKIIFAIQVISILTIGYKKIVLFDEMVENCYSETDQRTLRRVKVVLGVFVVASILSFIANIIGRNHFSDTGYPVAIPSILYSSLLFTLLYLGHKQDFTISELINENGDEDFVRNATLPNGASAYENENKSDGESESGRSSAVVQQITKDIEELMQQEKIYLQPDLRINDLAERLHTNREYIYQAINLNKHVSFAEYINRQRIEYAQKLLKANPTTPSTEIYLKAGFTSQASFFRNFKLYAHMTPKEYVQVHAL
ncbi:MAG: AraC family transcriptional regulator [Prevotella sp.]|nr:AraC family transcriptional regulator [Prevotella sp.]